MKPYSPVHIISENSKCGCSINLPIRGHCRPTKNCAACCYAKSGYTRLPASMRKQIYVSRYLASKDISRLKEECRAKSAVRISGTGDLLMSHVKNLVQLAKDLPMVQFWGMTRKLEIANAVNKKVPNLRILLSVDGTSPSRVWNYQGPMCWGPRIATDQVKDDPRIKTVFPYHFVGRVVKGMPRHAKDCKAVWHEISGCLSCGRCWSWS